MAVCQPGVAGQGEGMSSDEQRVPTPYDAVVAEARFRPVRLGAGYDMGDVDAFLDEFLALAGSGFDPRRMLDEAQFRSTRFREGYAAEDVDVFLDRLRSTEP